MASIHSHQEKFQCTLCDKAYAYESGLNSDMKFKHFASNPKPFECTVCKKGFTSKSKRDQHMTHLHSNLRHDKPFECLRCKAVFAFKSSLKRHLVDVHKVNGLTYECIVCNLVFENAAELNKHLKSAHTNSSNISKGRGKVQDCQDQDKRTAAEEVNAPSKCSRMLFFPLL